MSTTLTLSIVIDRADLGESLAEARRAARRLPDDGPVLAFDPDAWIAVRAAWPDRAVLAAADVLRRPTDVEAWANDLLDTWSTHARLDGDGWPLMECVAYRHVRWTRRFAAVAVPLRDAIERVRPARVRVLQAPSGHGLDQPADVRSRPILAGVAMEIARDRGVPVVVEPVRAALTSPALALAGSPASLEPATNHTPAHSPAHSLAEGHLLFVGHGPEHARHAVLAAHLRAITGRPVVQLGSAAGEPDGGWNQTSYAGPRTRVPVPGAGQGLADLRAAAGQLAPGSAGRLLAGDGVRSHLEFLFHDYAAATAGNIRRWADALSERRPTIVVAGYPEIPLEVAVRLDIPSVLLPHGPMMLGEDRYHHCLHPNICIGAVGERHRRMLTADGIAPQRVRVTGVPGTMVDRSWSPVPPGILSTATASPRPVRILVPCSESWRPSQVGSLPVTSFTRERRCLAELTSAAATRGWSIEVRPHPRYDRDPTFYRSAFDRSPESDVKLRSAADRPLDAALAECDVVVFLGAPSSVVPEAARAGRPVLLLSEPAIVRFRRRWGLDQIPAFADVAQLVAELERLAGDPAAASETIERTRRAGERLFAPGGVAGAAALVLETAGLTTRRRDAPSRASSP